MALPIDNHTPMLRSCGYRGRLFGRLGWSAWRRQAGGGTTGLGPTSLPVARETSRATVLQASVFSLQSSRTAATASAAAAAALGGAMVERATRKKKAAVELSSANPAAQKVPLQHYLGSLSQEQQAAVTAPLGATRWAGNLAPKRELRRGWWQHHGELSYLCLLAGVGATGQ